jgi:hypothetical protein
VFFGHYLPAEVLTRVVREHRLRLQRRLDQLALIEAAFVDDVSFPGATLRRGILNATAVRDWTDEVLARIDAAPDAPRRRRHVRRSSG